MIYGQYNFDNYTLINPYQSDEDIQSTTYHEFTHFMLSNRSTNGMLMYCFEKLVIPIDSEDYKSYESIKSFLIVHMKKVQEGIAVFIECVMKLRTDKEVYEDFICQLRKENKEYYNYVKPLLFVIEILKNTNDINKIMCVANIVFSLAIESLNTEILEIDPNEFKNNINKYINDSELSKKFLPNTRFKLFLKELKRADDSDSLMDIGIELLSDIVKKPTVEASNKRLDKIKKFILSFMDGSEFYDSYKEKLNDINVTEVDGDSIFYQQLPYTFNDSLYKKIKKIEFAELKEKISSKYSVIMLYGRFEDTLKQFKSLGIFDIRGGNKNLKEMQVIMFFDLKLKEVYGGVLDEKNLKYLLGNSNFNSKIVTTYKNYNYTLDKIDNIEIGKNIYIYCDRTYLNSKEYFSLWDDRQLFYRYRFYENLAVLIVKINTNRYFILPMTSVSACQAAIDIDKNMDNMVIPPIKEESYEYDPEIFIDDDMISNFDLIINVLYFMK